MGARAPDGAVRRIRRRGKRGACLTTAASSGLSSARDVDAEYDPLAMRAAYPPRSAQADEEADKTADQAVVRGVKAGMTVNYMGGPSPALMRTSKL